VSTTRGRSRRSCAAPTALARARQLSFPKGYRASQDLDPVGYGKRFAFLSNHNHGCGVYDKLWCVPRNVTGNTHTWAKNTLVCDATQWDDGIYRYEFVSPSGFDGTHYLQDGYPVHIYDTYLGKYCSNGIWPSNLAALLCDAATPSSSGQRFHFHWD
jgi:hypothetical protein